ncbi:hypothetical protein WICPIJ_008277 [Wickerhamomyces pijperi]|uniref:Glutaredoxin domain-containing protein n=1 Tax=Wickerhamomyces pijperi TaxID=599730 RepID=A0A9P8TI54_WICPI|nr:hypothetical protein WICPIJ_008277 [Wickerhamomyces pijperi]
MSPTDQSTTDPTPPLLSSNIHSFPTSEVAEVPASDPSEIQLHSIAHTPVPVEEEARDYVTVKELRSEGALLSTEDVDPSDVVVDDSKAVKESTAKGSIERLKINEEALRRADTESTSEQFVTIEHTPLYTPPVESSNSVYELSKSKTDTSNSQSLEDLIDSHMASMTELSSSLKQSISTRHTSRSKSPARSKSRQPTAATPAARRSPTKDTESDEKVQNKIFETPNLLNRGGSYSGVSEYRNGGTSSHSLYDSPTEFRAGRTARRSSETAEEQGSDEDADPMQRMRSGSRDYLRSISRSRTSISRETIIDENELESEGALLNDPEFNLELENAQNGVIDGKIDDDDIIGKLEREIGLFEVRGNDSKGKKKSKGNVSNNKKKSEPVSPIGANNTSSSVPLESAKEPELKEFSPEVEEPASSESQAESTPSVTETTETTPTVEEKPDKTETVDAEPIVEEPVAEEMGTEVEKPVAVEDDSKTNSKKATDEEFTVEEPLVEETSEDLKTQQTTTTTETEFTAEETEESSIHSKDDKPEIEEPNEDPEPDIEELNSGEVTEAEEPKASTQTESNSTILSSPEVSSKTAKAEPSSTVKPGANTATTIHDDAERLIKELEADLGGEHEETSSLKSDVDRDAEVTVEDKEEVKPIQVKEQPTSTPTSIPVQSTKEEAKQVPEEDEEFHEPTHAEIIAHLKNEPVYIYTSLAGGGFHMPQRTNRLVTILTANRIPFKYRDLGTDEEARNVWRRHGGGKSLPGVVRGKDDVIGNWEAMEELNEEYKVHEAIYETL